MKIGGIDLAQVNVQTALVLDVGCGQGWAVLEAARQGVRAIGLDLSPELLSKARSRVQQQQLDHAPSFILGKSDNVPLAPNSVDILICTELIEHTLETESTLGEMERLLKPAGQCIMSLPTKYTEDLIARFSDSFLRYSGHVKQFTLMEIKGLLAKHQIEVLHIQRKYFEWSIYYLALALLKKIPSFDRRNDRYGLQSSTDIEWQRVDYYYKRLWTKAIEWKFGIPILWIGNQVFPKSYVLICKKHGA